MFWTAFFHKTLGALNKMTRGAYKNGKWKHAHSQGRFVVMNFIMQNQKSEIIKLSVVEDDFTLTINPDLLFTEG